MSPTTARVDRTEKMPLYAQHGVGHLWMIDPLAQALEVYQRAGAQWLVVCSHGAEEQIRPEPFDSVPFDLGALWRVPAAH